MSGKLDQSLDEILSSQRRTAGRRNPARRSTGGRPTAAAPVGGVQKTSKPARNAAAKPAPAKGGRATGESKVIVSNLPKDVSEGQIKEYFQTAVGQVKKVELSYGPGGVSRGIASVIFHHADGASKAFQKLNGLLIDNRPVKVEVVVASADLIPAPKTLGQRITQPKAQPKSAATDKAKAAKAGGAAGKPGAKKQRGRSARPAKKTAEELDSEMADYFEAGNANGTTETTAAAPAPAVANGDAAMEDEIM